LQENQMARGNPDAPLERAALVIVDVQNDFCPGGALAVPRGDEILPVVNRLAAAFVHLVLTQDWHPPGHLSFASAHPGRRPFETVELAYGEQVLWPDHCVQGTRGAAFHADLDAVRAELVLRKGFRREIDSYSAFCENDQRTTTGLAGYLRERQIERLWLCGLATDYCVAFSAIDGRKAGFETTVVLPACRAIDQGGSLDRAMRAMRAAGVALVEEAELRPH
jgi:nicotinamidase/pyrazinamidase